ncbi:MAG: oxidoreductase, partial [Mycobacteriales bacterium]
MTSDDRPAAAAGTFDLGVDLPVARLGYGAMQLAGPNALGPPPDRSAAVAVLRRAVELGINHIDTSDYYGPHVVNEIIREALHPYPDDLVIVPKVGARRTPDGGWPTALSAVELRSAVEDNIAHLGLDWIDVANLRVGGVMGPEPGSIEAPFTALAELVDEGLIRHLGVSNVTADQLAEAQRIAPVVCVQNLFNATKQDDAALVDRCAEQGIAFVPFFPLGGAGRDATRRLGEVARRVGADARQVGLA